MDEPASLSGGPGDRYGNGPSVCGVNDEDRGRCPVAILIATLLTLAFLGRLQRFDLGL